MHLSVQENQEKIPKPQNFHKVPLRCFHATLESSVKITKTTGSVIYHVWKFLFTAFLTDQSQDTPIYIAFNCIAITIVFLTTSAKMHIKQCGDLRHSTDSETLNQNILYGPVSRCRPNILRVGQSAHSAESCSCSHHTISQNMEKHLSISEVHL